MATKPSTHAIAYGSNECQSPRVDDLTPGTSPGRVLGFARFWMRKGVRIIASNLDDGYALQADGLGDVVKKHGNEILVCPISSLISQFQFAIDWIVRQFLFSRFTQPITPDDFLFCVSRYPV